MSTPAPFGVSRSSSRAVAPNHAGGSAATDYPAEARFAVVMYGGVSLAIYINGVAQELLRMVRATAQNADGKALLSDSELSGSERVYRKLSYLVAEEPDDDQSEKGDQSGPIPTRFVVDTITG